MINRKLKAFTILELTIAMLVSAIVIAITYTGFQLISNAYFDFNHKHQDTAVLLQLDELLKKDFMRCPLITGSGKTLSFRDTDQVVTYQFTPDYILRTSSVVDTFKVQPGQVSIFFEGNTLNDEQEEPALTDELSFTILSQKQSIPYHYRKDYSAQDLFKPQSNAGN